MSDTTDRRYTFQELQFELGPSVVADSDRFTSTDLYGFGLGNTLDSGTINPIEAAYVFGSVNFSLQDGTEFIVQDGMRYAKSPQSDNL